MNIFYLDKDPKLASKYHNDKHTVKMILELAQLLCTAHRVLDGELYIELTNKNRRVKRWKHNTLDNIFYKTTHVNHPCSKWIRASKDHYEWTYKLFVELCKEYTLRFKKIHLTEVKLKNVLSTLPKNIPENGFVDPPQAMPNYCKCKNAVDGYRKYYMNEKRHINFWKNKIPDWYY